MKKISFIIPSRNNLKYLKWSYASIRKNLDQEHEICVASDFSNDGTEEWCRETANKDKNFKFIINEGPDRLGHTILYDKLINEVATNEICMIYHADMYACQNLDKAILNYLEKGTIVSATRIEPPLHPAGIEKIILDCGIEPEEFDENKLLENLKYAQRQQVTEGIFAPWAFYKSDFQEIGGHDWLFAPQSKEDSDIFNRFQLNGIKFLQTWEGFVYHMTCRGSRFKDGAKRNPDEQVFMAGRESDEWLKQNKISSLNFIRKWGSFVAHDAYMKPIIPHKYDIGIVFNYMGSVTTNLLASLEPWCNNLYIKTDINNCVIASNIVKYYIEEEQKNTKFDITKKILVGTDEPNNDVVVEFDFKNLNQNNVDFLFQLPYILADSGEIGEFQYDIFKVKIKSLQTYEHELIKVDNSSHKINNIFKFS